MLLALLTLVYPVEYMERGDAYLAEGHYEKAISDYQQVIQMLPKAVDARIRIGYVYLRRGDHKQGYQWFHDAIGIFPEFAEYDFIQRIKRNPQDVHAHYGLGLVYRHSGPIYHAVDAFETVIALDPDHEQARQYLRAQQVDSMQ